MLGGTMVLEKWRFYRQETKWKTESPAKIVLKKAMYETGNPAR